MGDYPEHSIATASGEMVDLANPYTWSGNFGDVAVSLAKICRFGGHLRQRNAFFSVAEHSIHVLRLVDAEYPGAPADLRTAALLHDAHEAFIGDVPTPLKKLIGGAYYRLRPPLDNVIALRAGIDVQLFHHALVVEMDQLALHIEGYELGAEGIWEPPNSGDYPKVRPSLPLTYATRDFMTTFFELQRELYHTQNK